MPSRIKVWHDAGIHVECAPVLCHKVGRVERFHHHDFDGPLPCGCDDD